MHALLAAMIALAVTALPGVARAADLSGVWVVDQVVWRQQLDGMIGAMLARMPADLVAQVRAQGKDPAEVFRAAAAEGLDGTIEFLPNGVVRSVTRAEGASEDGRWTLEGDRLRVEVDDADGLEALVGAVEPDRITLKPILEHPDPANPFLQEITYPLIRQR
jgi:hypothetical protein